MYTVADIYQAMDIIAPFCLALDYDNVGIIVGDRQKKVERVLLALDCTSHIVQKAWEKKCDLLITHHPVIFRGIKRVNENSLPYQLVKNDLSIICAHTNLDIVEGGVSDCLGAKLGLKNIVGMHPLNYNGKTEYQCRVGELDKEYSPAEFAQLVKERLNAVSVKYADAGKPIRKVVFCSGSGELDVEMPMALEAGADAYLTGEVKHNNFIDAVEAGLTLVEAGHFDTEDVVLDVLCSRLAERFPDIKFEVCHDSAIKAC